MVIFVLHTIIALPTMARTWRTVYPARLAILESPAHVLDHDFLGKKVAAAVVVALIQVSGYDLMNETMNGMRNRVCLSTLPLGQTTMS